MDGSGGYSRPPGRSGMRMSERIVYDGKRMRNTVQRMTVDYNHDMIRWMQQRSWMRTRRDVPYLRPDPNFIIGLLPPAVYVDRPANAVTTKFIHMSTNKSRHPVNVVRWTPEGRRMITGAFSGEFTLWNGLSFNFETILQAHDSGVRVMEWSHNGDWMVTADQDGKIKYWQSNMNNLNEFTTPNRQVYGLSFAPSDTRYATCAEGSSVVTIWSFHQSIEDRKLEGHHFDVRCVDWHPFKSLLASGSKDGALKLWDPRASKCLKTLHTHKNMIATTQWNPNGNWLMTAGKDQLIRIYDIRAMKEVQVFRGHKKDVCSARWHPHLESLLATGGSEGTILYWLMGQEEPSGEQENAHDQQVLSLDWHPVGHILTSGSKDCTTRFWTRPRPGETSTQRFDSARHAAEEVREDAEETSSMDQPPPFRPHHASQTQIEPPPFRPANMPIPSFNHHNNMSGPPMSSQPPMGMARPQYDRQDRNDWQDRYDRHDRFDRHDRYDRQDRQDRPDRQDRQGPYDRSRDRPHQDRFGRYRRQ